MSELPSCSLDWGCTAGSGEPVLNLRGGSVGGVGTRKTRVLRLGCRTEGATRRVSEKQEVGVKLSEPEPEGE